MQLRRVFVVCLLAALPAISQPAPGPIARRVQFGHIHLNAADPAASIAFWKDVLGASGYTHGNLSGVSMIGAIILFTAKAPTGPSTGSVVDHIAIKVPDVQPFVEKLASTSYKSFQPSDAEGHLMIDGPDGVRIELIEDSGAYATLEFKDVHFRTAQPKEMQAWYAKVFGAREGAGETSNSSQVRGATLIFEAAEAAAPTAGRALDHIGFEINGLEEFCKTLADSGVKVDTPYKYVPQAKLAWAFITDPWGTRIELTEGLAP